VAPKQLSNDKPDTVADHFLETNNGLIATSLLGAHRLSFKGIPVRNSHQERYTEMDLELLKDHQISQTVLQQVLSNFRMMQAGSNHLLISHTSEILE
jgi:hypothetical protein